jgi:NhaA family Na+:H+ antiporter
MVAPMTSRAAMLPVHERDHVRGPADADVTIVEYGDYDCPHTRRAHAQLATLFAELGPAAAPRFVYRHFPLRQLHANAEVLSELAEAAAARGKFWEMHDHLRAHRRAIARADVVADAAAAGIALARLEELLGTTALQARVEADIESGRASGVHSTPTFFFNGALHDGHYDAATLREQLARARRHR